MTAKILIANRGEIACRVIETARKMGLSTVAVFSDADATARHVALADEAVHIGPPPPGESYLDIGKIIDAARQTGAGAIHPGYGFLSENPDFVDAVETAGLIFIGPSAKAIRAMGLKDAAKALMEKANVPVVPGYHGTNQDAEHLAKVADDIGYPVLIKAVAGGGGKGMRKVASAGDFADDLKSARAEARTAFGNDAVLIEKFVEKPRHIEFQIFGDGTDALHLFERDCSLQRRHQKVIEEAPAPGMTEDMRTAMGEAAVRAAKAVGYAGAGTVEFIADASDGLRPDRFWFMEMNTRLQVEHPVTEEITGVDLVEWQIRVALGESLPATQSDLSITGHAIEARLYAEDVPTGFLPATGHLDHLRFAGSARIDTGVRQGDTITPHYDPMIAKLTVHGKDRASARAKMSNALARTEIAGTTTNIDFLARLIDNPSFAAGDLDTGIIERDLDSLTQPTEPSAQALAIAAVHALDLDNSAQGGFTLWSPLRHRIRLGETDVIVAPNPGGAEVIVEERTLKLVRSTNGWKVNGHKTALKAVSTSTGVHVFGPGGGAFPIADPLNRASAAQQGGAILSPMPGKVGEMRASVGDTVVAGQKLAVLEAMKMEHGLLAPRDGTIAEVRVATGDQVEAGVPLIILEDDT